MFEHVSGVLDDGIEAAATVAIEAASFGGEHHSKRKKGLYRIRCAGGGAWSPIKRHAAKARRREGKWPVRWVSGQPELSLCIAADPAQPWLGGVRALLHPIGCALCATMRWPVTVMLPRV